LRDDVNEVDGGSSRSVRDLGEFGLIDRLAGLVPGSTAVVGIGDDAAVLDVGGADYLLATIDMLVENVHFDLQDTEPRIIGRRALAINVSDIAAMGGEPSFALISLALPPSCSARFIEDIYEGLVLEAALTTTGIVGGNVTRISGPLCIDVTVLGRVPRDEVVLRSGARPGDVLVVTGSLGAAAARREARVGDHTADAAMMAAADRLPAIPVPRVTVARRLASGRIARAMLDLSDGLAGDVRHLCRASNVGAVLRADRLPISATTRTIAAALGVSPVSLALSGGEDYELLIAISPHDVERAQDAAGAVPLTQIGEVVSQISGMILLTDSGEREELPPSGWTHF
jgi:thiamine-monophosphate kinase